MAVDTRRHRVFIANGLDDTISVLDSQRGVVIRTISLANGRPTVVH